MYERKENKMSIEEIVVKPEDVLLPQDSKEWFIPIVDWTGTGEYWCGLTAVDTKEEAERLIHSGADIKQARIVRVMLPRRHVD